ncbi:hypothetical protein [Polaromonas sp. JS666]|uniref:hypothetical protein n=1 Tax=Polaromonas sp. (strain JS666 / ATCC BAA-500) TaxID=296591 RepID=UPI0000463CDA|nr:hypothetical protein [Polaromonas sp. JS666]ABE41974.1 hypothetical protein Bpro_0007 [Polaromonas sp. JS666]
MKKLAYFLLRPRYLRAIPSLVVLTTAMAWGVAPDSDAMDTVQKKAVGVTLSLNHTAAASANPKDDKPAADAAAGDSLAG